jgi:hypothetical protein
MRPAGPDPWTTERLKALLEEYRVEHPYLRFDPEARNLRHTHVTAAGDGRTWLVQQVLVDSEEHNDWVGDTRSRSRQLAGGKPARDAPPGTSARYNPRS